MDKTRLYFKNGMRTQIRIQPSAFLLAEGCFLGFSFKRDIEKAVEIVEKLDYDFEFADKDAAMGSGVIARTIMLDKMVSDYLCKHENAIVVNIACGLDTRCYRNEGKYKKWYNIDLPDTINVRSRFMKEEGPVIYQFAESAMDETWAEKIEYNGEPVLVIIEGLTMYLTEEDVVTIFDIIDKKFKKATVLVEVMNPFIVKNIKEVVFICCLHG